MEDWERRWVALAQSEIHYVSFLMLFLLFFLRESGWLTNQKKYLCCFIVVNCVIMPLCALVCQFRDNTLALNINCTLLLLERHRQYVFVLCTRWGAALQSQEYIGKMLFRLKDFYQPRRLWQLVLWFKYMVQSSTCKTEPRCYVPYHSQQLVEVNANEFSSKSDDRFQYLSLETVVNGKIKMSSSCVLYTYSCCRRWRTENMSFKEREGVYHSCPWYPTCLLSSSWFVWRSWLHWCLSNLQDYLFLEYGYKDRVAYFSINTAIFLKHYYLHCATFMIHRRSVIEVRDGLTFLDLIVIQIEV